jgi:RNA polymerase sigma-70 factor (ECF subfamily)
MDENTLLQQCRAFDLEALGEAYDAYSPRLYAYALRLLGDASQAEDAVAETFNRFLNVLRLGKGPDSHLKAYLYRVAHNWITDQYRRQPPPPLALDEELEIAAADDPEGETIFNLQAQKVRQALRMLTPEQRQVIVLKFIEGWNNSEVAEALDKPAGAIKSLQHRALEMLRRNLVLESENE